MVRINRTSLIVERIREKAKLLGLGDSQHSCIRPLLLLDGGGMRGVFGMGVGIGLQYAGLCAAFDVVLGGSAGACNGAWILSRQTRLAASVYYEDLTDRRFVNPWRFWKIADVGYAVNVFRHVKKLDVAMVKHSRSDFYVTATRVDDGVGEFIDAKKAADLIAVLHASMALPVLYNRPVQINGAAYLDGVVALPLPIEEALERFNPTDILIVLNRPLALKKKVVPVLEYIAAETVLRKFPRGFREAFLAKTATYNRSMRLVMSSNGRLRGANVGVICPESDLLQRLTKDPHTLKTAALSAARWTAEIFASREVANQIQLI